MTDWTTTMHYALILGACKLMSILAGSSSLAPCPGARIPRWQKERKQ